MSLSNPLLNMSDLDLSGKRVLIRAHAPEKTIDDVGNNDRILDIGSTTAGHYMDHIHRAGTVIWNGPVGDFKYDQFGKGTEALAKAVAESDVFSLVGGGGTIAAMNKYGVAYRISYISTGGGAFLEFLEGKSLPGVSILEYRTKQSRRMH
ncbi:MAG: phosphoglycerate kinase [Arenicellales bacterium]|nr:phosphoglycerate kinase [Arenicellales bacterium]